MRIEAAADSRKRSWTSRCKIVQGRPQPEPPTASTLLDTRRWNSVSAMKQLRTPGGGAELQEEIERKCGRRGGHEK